MSRSSSSALFTNFLGGEGSPTEIDKTEKCWVPTYSNLSNLEDLDVLHGRKASHSRKPHSNFPIPSYASQVISRDSFHARPSTEL